MMIKLLQESEGIWTWLGAKRWENKKEKAVKMSFEYDQEHKERKTGFLESWHTIAKTQ